MHGSSFQRQLSSFEPQLSSSELETPRFKVQQAEKLAQGVVVASVIDTEIDTEEEAKPPVRPVAYLSFYKIKYSCCIKAQPLDGKAARS